MQKDSKFLDDLARMGAGAFGGLLDAKREVEAMVGTQLEKMLTKMHLVTAEEHQIVQEMAIKAREENAKLVSRVDALEKRLNELAPR